MATRAITYRPTSNAGEAMGDSSVAIVKIPSNFLSSYDLTTSADILTMTLVLPILTSATPYSSPKLKSIGLKASKARPSSRTFSFRAWSRNARALVDGSASLGMLQSLVVSLSHHGVRFLGAFVHCCTRFEAVKSRMPELAERSLTAKRTLTLLLPR